MNRRTDAWIGEQAEACWMRDGQMGEMAIPNRTGLFGSRQQWSRECATAIAVGLFLGLAGPFGSYLNPSRLIVVSYWIGALMLGAILFGVIVRPAMRLAPRLGVPVTAMLLGSAMVASAPLGFCCRAVAATLWPDVVGRIGLMTWYGQTLLISLPLAFCYRLAEPPRQAADRLPAPAEPKPVLPVPPLAGLVDFRSRLPAQLGRELLALQMEDHYVRAHTTRGSTLVLIPLRQAIAELAAMPGVQTHRSWWVARDAVSGAFQDGRNLRLRLSNGLDAPVSRTHVAAARSAGLLTGLS